MSASWALQQAVYAALVASGDVAERVGDRVFDHVPRDAAFPYLVIGEDDLRDAGASLSEHLIAVHVWSRAAGLSECKEAAEAVRLALDRAELAVTGQTLIGIRHLGTEFARDADGETLSATVRFRAVLEPN